MSWTPEEPDYEEDEIMPSEPTPTAEGIEIKIDNSALSRVAERAAELVAIHLQKQVEKMVGARLDVILNDAWHAAVEERARVAIEEYLSKPRTKTNEWGEPIPGSTARLADQIVTTVESYMGQPVDSKGNPERGYDRSKYPTRVAWMLRALVTDELKRETEKAARDVTEKARVVVAQHVGRFISEQMVPAIDVSKG